MRLRTPPVGGSRADRGRFAVADTLRIALLSYPLVLTLAVVEVFWLRVESPHDRILAGRIVNASAFVVLLFCARRMYDLRAIRARHSLSGKEAA